MAAPPSAPAHCPPGLEYLTLIDQLLVKQKVEMLEAIVGFETNNKYVVKNSMGQQVFYMVEDTDCCTRQFCGNTRPFDMKVLDNNQQEVMHFHRPLNCDNCLPCWLQELEVSAPPGNRIGVVKQEWTFCKPVYSLYGADGITPILRIKGPFCPVSCCGEDIEFKVMSVTNTETQVGSIKKQWAGFLKEAFTDADPFGITFPLDLDVHAKATLLGALMLIDFLHFEKSSSD